MARITIEATDPIVLKTVVMGIYGMPNVGKTSVVSTAESPILFDFDKGVHRAGQHRQTTFQFEDWEDVIAATNADELAPYKTIVLDTVGRAAQLIIAYIVERERKKQRSHLIMASGQLTQSGYGELGNVFRSWLNICRSLNKDVIWIGHAKEDGSKKDDDLTYRVDMPGSSKAEIYQCSDVIAYMTKEKQGRFLDFGFNPYTVSKDIGLGRRAVPDLSNHPALVADLVAETKRIVLDESTKRVHEAVAFKDQCIAHAKDAMSKATSFPELNHAAKSIPTTVRLSDDEKHDLRKMAETERQRLLVETNKSANQPTTQSSDQAEPVTRSVHLIDKLNSATTIDELDLLASEIDLAPEGQRKALYAMYESRLAQLKQSA
jgi:hypothetical protein